ncbi:hypothetical protein SAMN06297129_2448 [Pseudooceanicola antarcticus]|uniref:Uncharacterized protein n=1 Tax=Pseudooceanicola antarcticus TaxID=1247613 RepID=A0A285J0R1_9RHOB|nr:hypothetical protein [Pseudooceanicola antarcticus]PJE25765.1 hypothetical protein CVM39_18850 [Pseudooceanicola antarcticus]SNY52946.1 hypothetical protein SAMN06297129_2448 [Pseudooceanicola antarcticus]
MGSSSSSSSATTNNTRDGRVAGDNGALGVSAEGDVSVHMVADEAFELGKEALAEFADLARGVVDMGGQTTQTASDALSLALHQTQQAGRTEGAQLSDQLIKIGIPAAALAFAVSKIWGK